jgi:anti-anti-sigma factor
VSTRFAVDRLADRGFRVGGRIDVGNANAAMAAGAELAASRHPVEVDLGALESADSVTLAVLLDWAARARRGGGDLAFRNVPDRLRSIAHLSDAEALLGLDRQESSG